MAAQPKSVPTPDELWLKKTFGVDLSKLDKEDAEGGKRRKEFLKDLSQLKTNWEYMKVMMPVAFKMKIKEADQKTKQKLADELSKQLLKIQVVIKKLDVAIAAKLAVKCCASIQELLAKADRSGSEIGGDSGENFKRVAGKIFL